MFYLEQMGEDMLVLVLKFARVNEERNRLGVDDYAVLQCVSKSVANAAKDIVEEKDCIQKAWRNTAFSLGYDSDFAIRSLGLGELPHCRGDIPKKGAKNNMPQDKPKVTDDTLLVNSEIVLRTFIKARRLLSTMDYNSVSKKKLVQLLNELTSKVAQDTFLSPWRWSFGSQSKTIRALMNLFESRFIEMRVLGCYFAFYFISLGLKLRNVPDNILSQIRFREVVIAKTASVREDLRNDITKMPFGFTEKIIRMLSMINNKLRKW